jgi:hypothetical protein
MDVAETPDISLPAVQKIIEGIQNASALLKEVTRD